MDVNVHLLRATSLRSTLKNLESAAKSVLLSPKSEKIESVWMAKYETLGQTQDGFRVEPRLTGDGTVELRLINDLLDKTFLIATLPHDDLVSALGEEEGVPELVLETGEVSEDEALAAVRTHLPEIQMGATPYLAATAYLTSVKRIELLPEAAKAKDAADKLLHVIMERGAGKIKDAGAYIPESAKEKAAERKIRAKAREQAKDEADKQIITHIKAITKNLQGLKQVAIKLNPDLLDRASFRYPRLVRLAVAASSNGSDFFALGKQHTKHPLSLDFLDATREIAALTGAFLENAKLLKIDQVRDVGEMMELAQTISAKAKLVADDVGSSYVERLATRACSKLSLIFLQYVEQDAEADAGASGLLGVFGGWLEQKNILAAEAQAKKENPLYQAQASFKKNMQPEFVRVGGKDVSGIQSFEELNKTFGLSGGQSGKSLSDDERRELIHRTASALSDLSDVLGIEPERMGLNGNLAIALAARGSPSKPVAHYEPKHQVINFSRKGGFDGSAGHEIFHAIDYCGDGVSIFDPKKELPDEVREAVRNLVGKMYQGDRDKFIAARKEEYKKWNAHAKKFGDELSEKNAKLNELKSKLQEAINQIKKERDNLRHESTTAAFPELKQSLEKDAEVKHGLYVHAVRQRNIKIMKGESLLEPLRARYRLATALAAHARTAIRYAEMGRFLHRTASGPASYLPKRFLEDHLKETGQTPEDYIPSEFVYQSSLYSMISPSKKTGVSGGSYWTCPQEVFARLAETYIQKKLAATGRENNMLTERSYSAGEFSVYPDLDDRPDITEGLDELIATLKHSRMI